MTLKTKLYQILAVVFLASVLLVILFYFVQVSKVVTGLAGIPAIGSLCWGLFQIVRDRLAYDRSVQQEENRNRFTVGVTSHMASIAFDKHVKFCEEYVEEMQKALITFLTEGPSKKVLGHVTRLVDIRRTWAVWLTPELETELGRFEGAIQSMGAKAWLLDQVPEMEQRTKVVGEMYAEFAELIGMARWDGKDISHERAVATIIGKLRNILGVDELTKLRNELVKRALENLKNSD